MLNERLQEWLNLSGTSRSELADMLHVSPRTVESWLGKKHRPIPARLVSTIERIITPPAEPGCIPLQLTFTDEEWERLTFDIPEGVNKEEVVKQRFMAVIGALRLPKL